MTTLTVTAGQSAQLGIIDGECIRCGSPRRRMGWLNYPTNYWFMCVASKMPDEQCDLPTEKQARRRLEASA